MMTTTHSALDATLEADRMFHVRWRGELANHLPMAAIALHKLGADPSAVERFASMYRKRLEPTRPRTEPIEAARWDARLGDDTAYLDYRDYFDGSLTRNGLIPTLDAHISRLAPAVASDAFHPLLRLAYGIAQNHPGEIASALAYWCAVYTPLFEHPAVMTAKGLSITDALSFLAQGEDRGEFHTSRGLITPRMTRAVAYPRLGDVLDRVRVTPDTLRELRTAARRLHALDDNFASLHTVTATHATRTLLEAAPGCAEALLPHFVQAFLALYVAEGSPSLPPVPEHREAPTWSAIRTAAFESKNDHAIKLAHTCSEEASDDDDLHYRWLAGRELKLT